ncbi:pilus assembly PilX N-terminal domain-containing protein [Fibrobacter sp.]|uniref:pilus assembly PilX N-terminal domain-containing protein n=1 Tax=Fibrobacter sp. TaxID=35828 RepID=UPI0038640861
MQINFFNIMTRSFTSKSSAKAGVSLIAVLLFMLIATIAATATWKWITSEGFSSQSRMIKREAFQSAEAGIQATRAWMTYHANDVGALIREYQSTENKNKPIKIDNQFAEFKKAGQEYDVWLTGVNTENSTYKLKILSKGKARSGKGYHSEVAIFKVDGLYKVKIPSDKKSANYDFDYSYFGGSTENHGNMNPTSMLVNGNWKGNPNTVTTTFVVTGNAELSGNNLHVGKTACIGGNLFSDNGFTGQDLYVVGNASNFTANLSGDVYFGGNVHMGSQATPGFNVGGNVFLTDTMTTSQGEFGPVIHGNFCTDEDALLLSIGTNNVFTVKKNVWMPGPFNVAFGSFDWNTGKYWIEDNEYIDQNYNKILFADSAGTAYIRYARPFSEYTQLRTSDRYFTQNGTGNKKCAAVTAGYGYGTHAYCATMSNGGWGWSWTWDDQWVKWNVKEYTPYKWERSSGTNKYFLYDTRKTDVEYKSYTRNDLQQLKGTNNGMPQFGASTVYAYHVGGEPFYYQDVNYTSNGFYGTTVSLSDRYTYYHYNCTGVNCDYERKLATGSPYCSRDQLSSGNDLRPFCSVPSWFQITSGSLSTQNPTNMECGEAIKDVCDTIWEKKTGCDGAKYKVDDLLKNSYDVFQPYAEKGCAANIKTWDDDVVTSLNNCYEEMSTGSPNNLFNGYLVVSVSSAGKKDPSGTLKGKFIIIFEDDPGQNAFPPTESDSYVFLYLRSGSTGELQPTTSGIYNYFIFTDENVSSLLFNNTAELKGSVYAKAEGCAKVTNMTIGKITTNQSLINDLIQNGVICPADAENCGTPVTISSASSVSGTGGASTSVFGTEDTYYVASAPQLKITLESQYKNKESESQLKNAQELDGSFIVLPRVVYMTRDPIGELKDYYGLVSLNSRYPVVQNTITCDETTIRTSGKLHDNTSGLIKEGHHTCEVTGTVNGKSSKIPFYLVVKGTLAGTTEIGFMQTSVEVNPGGSTTPTLVLSNGPATQSYTVNISITPASHTGWVITKKSGVNCNEDETACTVTIGVGEGSKAIFDVANSDASTGTLQLQVVGGEGYIPGTKNNTETIFMATSANVYLENLATYCSHYSCSAELQHKADPMEVPDCYSTGSWVNLHATGGNCQNVTTNQMWICDVSASVSLTAGTAPSGCEIIIPSANNSHTSPLTPNGQHYLYAGLKALKQTLNYGFAGVAKNTSEMVIKAEVEDRNGNKREGTCTYSEITKADKSCSIDVYRGSIVTLSLPNSPTQFNRWTCESGECDFISNMNQETITFTATGGATIRAHFNENDKHCFFDEFKMNELLCGSEKYCVCHGSNCDEKKWKVVKGEYSNLVLDTEADKIKISRDAARNKKESQVPVVTVLSSVQAGLYGTLKAQFKIPKIDTRNNNIARAAAENSGFLLRSATWSAGTGTSVDSSALFLNVYLNELNNIVARVCIIGSSNCMESLLYNDGVASYANDNSIVLLSATLKNILTKSDTLEVSVIPSTWSTSTYKASFILDNEHLSGVEALRDEVNHQSVGYRLSSPDMELYGIGWRSDDYNAECWETPPSVKCSFKAAYTGGIIKKDTEVLPWVGLSAWFNQGYSCEPHYYYNGDDSECSGSVVDESYNECTAGYYKFSTTGPHGSTNRIAKAAVQGCGFTGEESQWAKASAECGEFWVGDMSPCSESPVFTLTDQNSSGEYWSVATSTVNLRDATLNVELYNPDKNEIEIYLFSRQTESSYTYGTSAIYSKSFKTNADGMLSIDVSEFAEVEGFDPEHVGGVYVQNVTSGTQAGVYAAGVTTASVKSIVASCPHVLSFEGCYASFSASTNKWTLRALVNNYDPDRVGKIQVNASGSASFTNMDPSLPMSCNDGTTTCSVTDIMERKAVVFEPSDNPYANNTGKNYVFTFSMLTSDGNNIVEPCVTDPYTISTINAECSLNKNSVVVGAGIPVATYSLSGCPDEKCGYEVVLVEADVTLAENNATGDFAGYTTLSNKANTTASPLTKNSTYTVKMKQKSSARPFSDVTCGTFTVNDVTSQESEIQAGSCAFDNNAISLGQSTTFRASSFSGTAQSAAVRLLDDDGNEVSSNASFWTGGNYEVWNISPTKTGSLTYTLIVNGGRSCTATLNVSAPTATCTTSPATVEQWDDLSFVISDMTPTNSNLNLVITEKTGTTTTEKVKKAIWTGNSDTESWNMSSTGSFEYTVTLAGHEVCKKTVTVTAIAGSAQTCKFANTTRVYGEKVKFQVEKLKADKDATWELDDPNGTKVAEGTFANRYNMSFWETGDINVKASGTYTLKLNGSSACTADVTVTQPSAENCRLDASTIPTGSTTKFRWDLKNCKENQCSYEIRRAGVLFTSQSNVGEQNDRQYDVNDAGEYVVWLNGAATNCKQTLSIATSGSLTCSVDANILVGAQWQNVKVTSTRATSKYDLWIDNSIGKNTNGDDMSNFEIAENAANVGVGGFTCSPVGSHTYKITPHGNTTSLCNGSFNCVSAPTADCYFKYNNGGQTVTGSVPAETQLQFCVGPNIVDAQTTVKGTKKAGSFSEGLYLNKNQTNCYYFEAPSTKDSYTFSVEYDENEVCNTTPTLVVE